ncbi:CBS domain-containing protein [archaeon]|nr:CBS domain-containing protein [archaeon]
MKISEIMTKKVEFINLETSLQKAAEKMREEDIGALPVVDPSTERIKGMLTDRDIVIRAAALGKDLHTTPAKEAMTKKIRYVFEDEELNSAADQMIDNQIRRVVVLNREKRLVGLVSLSDLACRAKAEKLSGHVLKTVNDTAA